MLRAHTTNSSNSRGALLLAMGLLAGCTAAPPELRVRRGPGYTMPAALPGALQATDPRDLWAALEEPRWARGEPLMQGFFGAVLLEEVRRAGGSTFTVDGSEDGLETLPLIGGGGQFKYAGDTVDFGLEGLLAFSGRANASAFAFGGGGAVLAVDVDLLLFDLYGGPFLNVFLGERLRVYGAAGPLLQWAEWDQDGDASLARSGSGFGVGLYARAGIEFRHRPGRWFGFGARWSDTTIDLDNNLGDLDVEGVQILFTMSEGL